MTDKEKLEKAVKLADAMYYAAQYLTTDASRLHKAMEEYHNFMITEYNSQEPASEDFESEWKRYCDSKGGGAVTMNMKDMAHHFAQWGVECVKKSQKTLHVAKSYKENGDSLTDEELEIAAGKYAYYEREDDIKGEGGYDLSKLEGFIEGANWQKGQMMKDAIEGEVFDNYDKEICQHHLEILADIPDKFTDGDKVKVIIIKE